MSGEVRAPAARYRVGERGSRRRLAAIATLLGATALSLQACGWSQQPVVSTTTSPGPSAVHLVQSGDTLSEIAVAYGSSVSELASLNGLAPPYLIRVGEGLVLPARMASARPSASLSSRTEPRAEIVSGPTSIVPTEVSAAPVPPPLERPQGEGIETASAVSVVAPTPPRRPMAQGEPATTPVALPERIEEPGGPAIPGVVDQSEREPRFSWPIAGDIVEAYGGNNLGIDIAADRGTVVRVSASGSVAYADDELAGFGNLILVRHAGDWVTAYAHLDQMLVGLGDEVAAGAIIGTVGSTGADRSALHFEIRQGRDPVDPIDKLPPL